MNTSSAQDTSYVTPPARISHVDPSAPAIKAMFGLEQAVRGLGLEPSLLHLVRVRASQINGCSYCVNMHTAEARTDGESEERLYLLSAWQEAPVFTARERAALAWTEAVTRVADTHVPDNVFAQAKAEFNEEELLNLTLAVIAINGWNRLNVAFRNVPAVKGAERRNGQVNRQVSPAGDARVRT